MAHVSDLITTPEGRECYITVHEPGDWGNISKAAWKTWRVLRWPTTAALVLRDAALPWTLHRKLYWTTGEALEAADQMEQGLKSGTRPLGWLPAHGRYRPS